MRFIVRCLTVVLLVGLAACQTTQAPTAKAVDVSSIVASGVPLRLALDGNYCLLDENAYPDSVDGRIWAVLRGTERDWKYAAYFMSCDDYRDLHNSIVQEFKAEGGILLFASDGEPTRLSISRERYIAAVISELDQTDQSRLFDEGDRKITDTLKKRGIHQSRSVEDASRLELVSSDLFAAYFRVRFTRVRSGSSVKRSQYIAKTLVSGIPVELTMLTGQGLEKEVHALDVLKRLALGLFNEKGSI